MNTYFSVIWLQVSKLNVNFERFSLQQAQRVILSHNASKPLFLYLPFQSVHGPLQVPKEYKKNYRKIADKKRRIYAGMVENADEAIGNITQTMKTAGWVDNTKRSGPIKSFYLASKLHEGIRKTLKSPYPSKPQGTRK